MLPNSCNATLRCNSDSATMYTLHACDMKPNGTVLIVLSWVKWEPALSGEQKLDGRAHHCITLGSQGDTRWMRICARACAAPAGVALVAREAVTPPSLSLS